MRKVLIHVFFVFCICVFVVEAKAQIGHWHWNDSNLPEYQYSGVLPFTMQDDRGEDSLLPEDPYFLLGNYRLTVFAHVSGTIEMMTAERAWARINADESRPNYGVNNAFISYGRNRQQLCGMNSLATDNSRCKRTFGVGFARYDYTLPEGIACSRTLSVKPSAKVNEGVSELLVSVTIRNNGRRKQSITYREGMPINFVPMGLQMQSREERAVAYDYKVAETSTNSVRININAHPNKFLVWPESNEASLYEVMPPSVYIQSTESVSANDSELSTTTTITLKPGSSHTVHYVIGIGDNQQSLLASATCNRNGAFADEWRRLLPEFNSENDTTLRREMTWNAYIMEASAKYSTYFDETFIPQGSVYSYHYGDNIANRDHLQALLPACYTNPQLARSALLYVLKQTHADGELTRGNQGYGYAPPTIYKESDQQLYVFQSMAEYLRITHDYSILNQNITLYPAEAGRTTTVMDCLKRQFVYLRDEIGRGENGLVRLQNSDWSDSFLHKYSPNVYNWSAESHLNSAMVMAVMPEFIRQMKAGNAPEAFTSAMSQYCSEVSNAFRRDLGSRPYSARAYLDQNHRFGLDLACIEPHSYLLQAEGLTAEHRKSIYQNIRPLLETPEKIGIRTRERSMWGNLAQGEDGGIWFSLEYPLSLGVASFDQAEAWRLLKKFSFENFANHYPQYWMGHWTAADEVNSTLYREGLYAIWIPIENYRHTFQGFCSHPHTWPLYCYYKLKEKK